MGKKFILVFLMVLGFSFTASANTLTDAEGENEATQGVVVDGELVEIADFFEEDTFEEDIFEEESLVHLANSRSNRGRGNVGRGGRGRGNVGRGGRGRGHIGRGRRHFPISYTCYFRSRRTGQQFWGTDYNRFHAQARAQRSCHRYGAHCIFLGCN